MLEILYRVAVKCQYGSTVVCWWGRRRRSVSSFYPRLWALRARVAGRVTRLDSRGGGRSSQLAAQSRGRSAQLPRTSAGVVAEMMPAVSTDAPLSEEELQDMSPPPPKPLPKYLSDASLRRSSSSSGLGASGLVSSAPDELEPRYKRVIGEPEWYRRMAIHPHSPGRVSWDTVSMIFLLYNAFIVPLRICFDVTDYCPSGIWIFEGITDWFFVRPPSTPYPPLTPTRWRAVLFLCPPCLSQVTDFFSNFFTAVMQDVEDLKNRTFPVAVAQPSVVAKEYLRSWFALDLVSSLPIDFFFTITTYGCVGHDSGLGADRLASLVKLVRVVKLVKLLKLFRLLKLKALLAELKDHYPIPEIVIKGSQLLGVVLFAGHITACIWYIVGRLNYTEALQKAVDSNTSLPDQYVSWLQDAQLAPADPLNGGLTWAEVGPPYIASFYWAFTTMTSTGYGDLAPMSESERSASPPAHMCMSAWCRCPPANLLRFLLCVAPCARCSVRRPCDDSGHIGIRLRDRNHYRNPHHPAGTQRVS